MATKQVSSNVGTPVAAMKPVSLTFGEKMLAGAIARCAAQGLLHPVDVVRTRLQARGVSSKVNASILFKGITPQVFLAIPAGAIQFLAFETAKEKLVQWLPDEKLNQTRVLLAGAFGAATAASVRVPQELLKQRIQADIYPNFRVALAETLGKQGFGSLYKGALATLSRDIPWNALSFMFHAQGKTFFQKVKGRAPANDENLMLAGAAGAVAAVIMTPIDVVKTRIMTARLGTVTEGVIQTLRTIVREEGAGTLMKGAIPRVIFLAPLAGITFSVYEAVAAEFRRRKTVPAPESGTSTTTTRNHPYKHLGKFAMRFSKSPVRLASRDRISGRGAHGDYLGDYEPVSSLMFSTIIC